MIGFNITLAQYFVTEAQFTPNNKYVGSGYPVGNGCSEHWWEVILYITNFTKEGGCVGQTWYLVADMQMFIASPLLILPMFYWQKNNWGLKMWLLVLCAFSSVPLTITLLNGLPPYGLL